MRPQLVDYSTLYKFSKIFKQKPSYYNLNGIMLLIALAIGLYLYYRYLVKLQFKNNINIVNPIIKSSENTTTTPIPNNYYYGNFSTY